MTSSLARDVRAILRLLEERLPVPTSTAPPSLVEFLLDPLENKLVRAILAAGRPLGLKQLAQRTGTLAEGGRTKTTLRATLAGLVRRKVLLAEHRSYLVNPRLVELVPTLADTRG